MSEAGEAASPTTVTGDNSNQVDFVFTHQPSGKGIAQQPGAVLTPHPIIQLTGAVDPWAYYSATAAVVQCVDAQGKELDPHEASRPEAGREDRSRDGSVIKFQWANLSADLRGWYYVRVTLQHHSGAGVGFTMHDSEKFYAGTA